MGRLNLPVVCSGGAAHHEAGPGGEGRGPGRRPPRHQGHGTHDANGTYLLRRLLLRHSHGGGRILTARPHCRICSRAACLLGVCLGPWARQELFLDTLGEESLRVALAGRGRKTVRGDDVSTGVRRKENMTFLRPEFPTGQTKKAINAHARCVLLVQDMTESVIMCRRRWTRRLSVVHVAILLPVNSSFCCP
jgi:hypothetical protein